MPSRDWVVKQASERKMSAPEAEKQYRRLLHRLGGAYHRRVVEEHAEVADRYGRMVKSAEMAQRLKDDA